MDWQEISTQFNQFSGVIALGVSLAAWFRSCRAMRCEANIAAETRRLYTVVADAVSGVTLTSEITRDYILRLVAEKHQSFDAELRLVGEKADRAAEDAASPRYVPPHPWPRIAGRDPEADRDSSPSPEVSGARLCPDCGRVHLNLVGFADTAGLPRDVCADCVDQREARA